MNGKVLIACRDEDYLMMLAEKLYFELDNSIQVNAISDYEYLSRYISQEKVEEQILILGQEYYSDNPELSKFDCIVLLDENEKMMHVINSRVVAINPFLKLDAIYDFIISQTLLKDILEKTKKKDTRLIAVYSPVGGSGKTTVAYGLAMAFAKAYKKVLYINPGPLQDFGFLFQNPDSLEPKLERMIAKQDGETISLLLEAIRNYGFDFLPPARMSFATLGISLKDYVYAITELKRINRYDYIVIDMMSEFNVEMAQIIGQADRIVCIGLQDAYSAFRMKRFLDNIDAADMSRYIFLCNKYDAKRKDYITEGAGAEGSIKIKKYIPYMTDLEQADKLTEAMKEILEQVSILCIS